MVDSPHTSTTHIEQAQSQKEVTANEALDRLAEFIAETRTFSGVTADVTPTTTSPDFEWQTAVRFILSGTPGVQVNFNTPASVGLRKLFIIKNSLDAAIQVQVTGGAGVKVLVPVGQEFLLYSDGADIIQEGGGGGDFLSLNDTPASYAGSALFNVRVNSGATALEFAQGTQSGTNWAVPFKGAVASRVAAFSGDFTTTTPIPWDTKTLSAPYNGFHFFLGANATVTFDNTTEQVALTAHGMVTGDGPFQLTTTGALPTGLAVLTDYWAIRISDNAFQVASSLANALASTPVTFTTDGSGTNTIDRNKRMVIPTGVTKVRLGGGVKLSNFNTAGSMEVFLFKNGAGAFIGNPDVLVGKSSLSLTSVVVSTGPLTVTPGDQFTLNILMTGDTSVDLATDRASFWIEVLETTEATDPVEKVNKIINGNMDVWQRGTSFATPASGAYTADRWLVAYDGTIGTFTLSRQAFTLGQTDVPGEPAFFLRWDQTVAGSASTIRQIQQRIESVRTSAGGNLSVAFWAKADAARTVGVFLRQHFGTGGSPSTDVDGATQNINLTTSWQRFTLLFSPASITGKTLGTAGNDYLGLVLGLPLNVVMTIDLARAQAEDGLPSATFDPLPPEQVLALCQRYYQKTFELATAPAQSAGLTNALSYRAPIAGVFNWSQLWPFAARMRAAPTLTYFNPSAANTNWRNVTGAADSGAASSDALNTWGVHVLNPQVGGDAAGDQVRVHATAEAEL